ncbi:MAG: PAS domain-containing protein [Chromatiales bacterium]|jgi:hypothetical protein|nr:PAS domain-containing protein [Chromatiales bacterium]MDX9766983.1 PAS domain-containing protein [Ectothiorhodospiraceae bacterium]
MHPHCNRCQAELDPSSTSSLCPACAGELSAAADVAALRAFVDGIDAPVLLMQREPRQVVTANTQALRMFGKDLSQTEGHRGGEVFDCVHAFTPAGCGKDVHCESCPIKTAVLDSFATGAPSGEVQSRLTVVKDGASGLRDMQVSTAQAAGLVLLRIDRYDAV